MNFLIYFFRFLKIFRNFKNGNIGLFACAYMAMCIRGAKVWCLVIAQVAPSKGSVGL